MPIQPVQLEEGISIKEIERTDKAGVLRFCEVVNELSPISWKLTPQRLLLKMGKLGAIFGLFSGEQMIGTVAIKEASVVDLKAGEIGYLYLHPDFKTMNNMLALFYHAIDNARRFDLVFLTTIKKDLGLNRLFDRAVNKVKFAFEAKLKTVSTIVNFWVAVKSNGKYTIEERIDALKSVYQDQIVEDSVTGD